MEGNLHHKGIWTYVTLAIVAGVTLSPATSPSVAAARGGGSGSLAVATEPAGATVFIDGSVAGQTPLQVAAVDSGDHRVRVVKDGYLENARVVTVSASQTKSVYVKLTPKTETAPARAEQVSSTGGGGGGSKKWLWIGLAGAGAATAAVLVLNQNHAPTAGSVTVNPTATGMAGVTSFAFSSSASDEDGDNLSYSWNFGDNATGTGATPTHVYATAGTFNVTLTVSDGKKDVTAPNASVRVGPSLTGSWTGGSDFHCGVNTNLTQSGANLTGQMLFAGSCTGTITIASGTVSGTTHPANITWTSNPYTFTGFQFPLTSRFTGATDANGTVMTGTLVVSDQTGTVSTQTTFRR